MREQSALPFEHHVAPSAATAAGLIGICHHAAQAEQAEDQAFAHKSLIHIALCPDLFDERGRKPIRSFGEGCGTVKLKRKSARL
ncbi:hypothetical protein D3C80_1507620 [compost metagenome]